MKQKSVFITLAIASLVGGLVGCSKQEESVSSENAAADVVDVAPVPAADTEPAPAVDVIETVIEEEPAPAADAESAPAADEEPAPAVDAEPAPAADEEAVGETVADALSKSTEEEVDVEAAEEALEWFENIEAALEKAKDEGKQMVLVEFTGSDWCPPCKFLRGKVFPSKMFVDFAKDKFLFVELDYPRQKEQTPETAKYNAEKMELYHVSSFPTVMLFDVSSGRPAAVIVGGGETPEKYLERFAGDYENAKQFLSKLEAATAETDSAARAKMLHEIYETIPPTVKPFYIDEIEEKIILADPSDPFGIVPVREERKALETQFEAFKSFMEDVVVPVYRDVNNDREKFNEAGSVIIEKLEPVLADAGLRPQIRQLYLYHALAPAYAVKDIEKLLKIYQEVVEINPETREGRNAEMILINAKKYKEEQEALKKQQLDDPVPAADEEPAPAADAEPAPAADEEPAPAADEEPVPVADEEPVPVADEEPVPAADEEPVPAVDEEPVPAADEEPVPAADEEPVPAADEEPVPAADEEPAPAADEEPAPAADEEPVPAADEEPASAADEEPVPAADEEPVPAADEEPVPAADEDLPEESDGDEESDEA